MKITTAASIFAAALVPLALRAEIALIDDLVQKESWSYVPVRHLMLLGAACLSACLPACLPGCGLPADRLAEAQVQGRGGGGSPHPKPEHAARSDAHARPINTTERQLRRVRGRRPQVLGTCDGLVCFADDDGWIRGAPWGYGYVTD